MAINNIHAWKNLDSIKSPFMGLLNYFIWLEATSYLSNPKYIFYQRLQIHIFQMPLSGGTLIYILHSFVDFLMSWWPPKLLLISFTSLILLDISSFVLPEMLIIGSSNNQKYFYIALVRFRQGKKLTLRMIKYCTLNSFSCPSTRVSNNFSFKAAWIYHL